jgi:hypothetical protein
MSVCFSLCSFPTRNLRIYRRIIMTLCMNMLPLEIIPPFYFSFHADTKNKAIVRNPEVSATLQPVVIHLEKYKLQLH